MPKNRTTKTRLQSSSKAKSGSSKPKTQGSSPTASYSALKKGFDAQARELRDALEREMATSEILHIIASSPTDIQPVLNAVAESAARLRAALRLRLADAVQAASALAVNAAALVTHDRDFSRVRSLRVIS